MGVVSAFGMGVQALMDGWIRDQTAIEGGQARCDDVDAALDLGRKDALRTDRYVKLALAAAKEAVEMAGIDAANSLEPSRAGCIVGTAFGGIGTVEAQIRAVASGTTRKPSATAIPMGLTNAATATVAKRYSLRGPTFPIGTACAAGADAVAMASKLIEAGVADVMIAGGAEAPFTDYVIDAFRTMNVLSTTGVSRPFDKRRDGFVLGEGAAIFVLESAEHARGRGQKPLGTIRGSGMVNDNHHITSPAPDGSGICDAMLSAVADAGIAIETIDYVNAHGTSTPANDRIETLGIKQALGDHAWQVPVSSTKSAIGHLLGAGGAIELASMVDALSRRIAPPTVGYEESDPELDLDFVAGDARGLTKQSVGDVSPLIGISNSAGFGGHNTAICLASSH